MLVTLHLVKVESSRKVSNDGVKAWWLTLNEKE